MPAEVSIIVISFNTKELLKKCLNDLIHKTKDLTTEIIVVDNASSDGSQEMISNAFPQIHLIANTKNVGFGAANNQAFNVATGSYLCLLNSDAFLHEHALQNALEHIQQDKKIGVGGARLVGNDGSWQPSARLFPSFVNEFLQMTGLSSKFPYSPFFGRYNRTWASPNDSCETDWVPGAFALIPKKVIDEVGGFDERFFLYFEEVDLCQRIKNAGYKIVYWSDVVVTHLGGESTKTIATHVFSKKEAQLLLWRMRSELLYFRKHYGFLQTYVMKLLETNWHRLRAIKNVAHREKRNESLTIIQLMKQAWKETKGGKLCPPTPWK